MVLYPTQQWLEEYKQRMNESDKLSEAGSGWGVGFDGTFLFVITEVPIGETTIGELPEAALEDIPDHLRGQLAEIPLNQAATLIDEDIRQHLPERSQDLLRQVDEHIVENTVYALIGLQDGGCTEVDILSEPDEREVGFILRGSYETWRKIVDGELDPIPAVMSGDLEIEGNMQRVLQYADATQLLGDISSDIETTHLF